MTVLRVESEEHGEFHVPIAQGQPPPGDGESTSRSLPTEPPVQYDALQPKLKDETLDRYKELRDTCCINKIPVKVAVDKIRGVTKQGKLNQEVFVQLMTELADEQKVGPPKKENLVDVFKIFDKNNDGVVDMLEAVCGFALFAKGDENERLHAVFECFDIDDSGFISTDEMYTFLLNVYKVVLTPKVLAEMKKMGVELDPKRPEEDLAEVTTADCFKIADLDKDGQLSFSEFKLWFQAPKNDANFQNSPLRGLLEDE